MNINGKYQGVKQATVVSVTGYLTVHDKHKSGNAMQIAIESDEFVTYNIETDPLASQMFPLVLKRLHLKGQLIGEYEKNNPIIRVSAYSVLS